MVTVIKVVTVIVMEVIMQLKKRNSQSARCDHDNNKWLVGTEEYQWTDIKDKPVSDWMDLDSVLKWIIQYEKTEISRIRP
jgi:hypothetical protein